MAETARLLVETSDSALAISEKIGLGSSTYFFTLFKKTYGMTPARYRAKHKPGAADRGPEPGAAQRSTEPGPIHRSPGPSSAQQGPGRTSKTSLR